MSDTVIISLAPVAADCPRVIPEELAQEILASVEYGAAIVHLHVRDKQGRLTPDTVDFQATIDPVMRHSNLIIQASTGGVSSLSIAERCAPLAWATARNTCVPQARTLHKRARWMHCAPCPTRKRTRRCAP